MKKITPALAILFFVLPSISSATALTQQQSSSLITVVQSSPGTPASAFVSLITAFSNITVTQATSLIIVVQAAPSVPADAFVDLLTSFTEDTPVAQSVTPTTTSPDVCTNIQGIQTTVPSGMSATGNACVATQTSTPTTTSVVQSSVTSKSGVFVIKGETHIALDGKSYLYITVIVKDSDGNIIVKGDGSEYITIATDGVIQPTGTAGEDSHKIYTTALNQYGGKSVFIPSDTKEIVINYKETNYPFTVSSLTN